MTSKVQLGWRADNADEILFGPLFKFAYQEGMLVIPHGEKGTKWNQFVTDLFLKLLLVQF